MPLVIEDGTCPENANSYVSLEQADAYLVPRNLWPAYVVEKPVEPEEPENPETPSLPEGEDGDVEADKELYQSINWDIVPKTVLKLSPDTKSGEVSEPEEPEEPNEGGKEPQELSGISESPEEEAGQVGDNGQSEGGDDEPELPDPDPELPDNPDAGTELPDTSKPDDNPDIAKKEAALMRAFDYLNGPLIWKGNKVDWQRMIAWPRENVPIPGCNPKKPEYIANDVIPEAVCRAQMELAAFIYNGRDPLAPLERGGKYQQKSDSKSESVDVLSESESHSIAYAENAPIDDWLPSVYSLLRPFLEEVPGEVQSGFKVHDILRG